MYNVSLFAQSHKENGIPQVVSSAFSSQYPQAKIKHWKKENTNYQAKFKLNGNTSFATYNQDGEWLNTRTKVKWSWRLPAPVLAGFKNSRYATWEINTINKIEEPSETFYRLFVDDGNLQIDIFHMGVFTKYFWIDFGPDGNIEHKTDVTAQSFGF